MSINQSMLAVAAGRITIGGYALLKLFGSYVILVGVHPTRVTTCACVKVNCGNVCFHTNLEEAWK